MPNPFPANLQLLHENLYGSPNTQIDPTTVAHDRSRILMVAYSDFSVRGIKISSQMWLDATKYTSGTDLDFPGYTNLLYDIEAGH